MSTKKSPFSPFLLKGILGLLLNDEEFREKFFPILSSDHFAFDNPYIYKLAKAIWLLYDKYGKFPSLELIVEEVFKQKGKNIGLFQGEPSKEEIDALKHLFLDLAENDVADSKYIEENLTQILGFLAVQKIIIANTANFQSGRLDVEEFTKEIMLATSFSSPINLGLNLLDDLDKRTDDRLASDITPGLIELNIPYFARYLEEGGLPPGSLGFFLASTNGGKSASLIQLAHDAAFRGHNVLYVTNELSLDMAKRRFDACFTGIPIHDVKKSAVDVRNAILASPVYKAAVSRLHLVEVPTGVAKVSDIEGLVEKLKKKGFNSNLLVIDYADNLRGEGRSTVDYRHQLTSIYKDLRGIAQKYKTVVWTASQMNDSGTEASEKKGGTLTVRHVNEARGKIHIADLCLGIARTQDEKDSNTARLVMIKNRLGSGDGAVVQISTRFDISRLFDEEKNIVPMSSLAPDQAIEGMEDLITVEELEAANTNKIQATDLQNLYESS